MKRCLVEFSNGKFGIRYGRWPFYLFQDFRNKHFKWTLNDIGIEDCMTTEDEARSHLKPSYRVVK